MFELNEELRGLLAGAETVIEDDGVIGIPVKCSVLHDASRGAVCDGYGGTPIAVYVVNTQVERIGTYSDERILGGILERGYIAVILDYLGNEAAVFPKLDLSVQTVRQGIIKGDLFRGLAGFPEGQYPETVVVPAGYDLSYGNVYWELDKHGADGSLEKVVEIWNNDFRGTNAGKLIKWTDAEGKRKPTQAGHDGSAPVWYDAGGNECADGEYIKVKHTLAEKITDCVKRDGSPIDLRLYMHIVYPTEPKHKVPVMCLASSSENLCKGSATPDRPQLNGFLFNGYAGVMYDYGYTPMARCDHYGYFDGYPKAGYITGDNTTYSLKHYNEHSDMAAMRYLRYLALSDSRFAFDTDAIGVYGNSKGGWTTFLGEKEISKILPTRRKFNGHHGETRYENGDTESRDGINGGEPQPWLSYNGQEIFGGANLVYSSCGAFAFGVTEGHCPMFISCNRRDESCFSTSNAMVNLSRTLGYPAMWLEIPLPHTLVYGEDLLYGIDSYTAFFDFAGYYLKGDAVKAVGARVRRDCFPASVTLLFSGAVEQSEADKIKLVRDADGTALKGTFTPCYGGLEWTFTPDAPVYGTGYTLSVPASLKGDNGKTVQKEFSYAIDFGEGKLLNTDNAEAASDGREAIAFRVDNDGINTVAAYGKDGECIGKVNTSGKGWYKIPVEQTQAVRLSEITLKAERACGITERNVPMRIVTRASGEEATAPDGKTALRVSALKPHTAYPTEVFYAYPTKAVQGDSVIKDGALTDEDVGRCFRISFKVYDTVSRYIQYGLNHCASRAEGINDYGRALYNVITRPGEWTEYSFDHTVYEPIFGDFGKQEKCFELSCDGHGDLSFPIYISDLKCVETVTEVQIGATLLVREFGEPAAPLGKSDIVCEKAPWSK